MIEELLPNELLHKIFIEIDSTECWCTLRLVSRKFKSLIENKIFWIKKLSILNVSEFGVFNNKNVKKMVETCINSEKELKAWKLRDRGIGFAKNAIQLKTYAFVDCCELILCDYGYLIFTGSRDKAIRAWKIRNSKIPFIQQNEAHSCWIKQIIGLSENRILSSGFDGSLTLWSIENGNLQLLDSISLKSTVLTFALNSRHIFTLSADNIIRMTNYSSTKKQQLSLKWIVKYFKNQTIALACCDSNGGENEKSTTTTKVFCSDKSGWMVSLNSENWKKMDSIKFDACVLSIKIIEGNNEIFCGLADGDLAILTRNLKIIKRIQVLSANIPINHINASLTCIVCISNGGSVVVYSIETMKEIFRGSLSQRIIEAQSLSNHFVFLSNNGGSVSYLSKT